jgi:hypothetical protein
VFKALKDAVLSYISLKVLKGFPLVGIHPGDLSSTGLTDPEKSKLRELLHSDTWGVLEKVWETHRRRVLFNCATLKEDQRYWQGVHLGYYEAERVLLESLKPKPEKTRAPKERLPDFFRRQPRKN